MLSGVGRSARGAPIPRDLTPSRVVGVLRRRGDARTSKRVPGGRKFSHNRQVHRKLVTTTLMLIINVNTRVHRRGLSSSSTASSAGNDSSVNASSNGLTSSSALRATASCSRVCACLRSCRSRLSSSSIANSASDKVIVCSGRATSDNTHASDSDSSSSSSATSTHTISASFSSAGIHARNINRTSVMGASKDCLCALGTGSRRVSVMSVQSSRVGIISNVSLGRGFRTSRFCLDSRGLFILNGVRGARISSSDGALCHNDYAHVRACSLTSVGGPGSVKAISRDNCCHASHFGSKCLCMFDSCCVCSAVAGGSCPSCIPLINSGLLGRSSVCLPAGRTTSRCLIIDSISTSDPSGTTSRGTIVSRGNRICIDRGGVCVCRCTGDDVLTSGLTTGGRAVLHGLSCGGKGLSNSTRNGMGKCLGSSFDVSRCSGALQLIAAIARGIKDSSRSGSICILSTSLGAVNGVRSLTGGRRICSTEFLNGANCFIACRRASPLFSMSFSSPRGPGVLNGLGVPNFSRCLRFCDSGLLLNVNVSASRGNVAGKMGVSVFSVDSPSSIGRIDGCALSRCCCSSIFSSCHTTLISPRGGLVNFPLSKSTGRCIVLSCSGSRNFRMRVRRRIGNGSCLKAHNICTGRGFCIVGKGTVRTCQVKSCIGVSSLLL